MQQTRVTDQNFKDYYQVVYPQQHDAIRDLIDITQYANPVMIDCCGWYYEEVFNNPVTKIECFTTVKDYQLDRSKFNKLIDNRDTGTFVWPQINNTVTAVILDRSPMLKYRSPEEINDIVSPMIQLYSPEHVVIRASLTTIDDNRFGDRILNLRSISLDCHYIIEKFVYDIKNNTYISVHKKIK